MCGGVGVGRAATANVLFCHNARLQRETSIDDNVGGEGGVRVAGGVCARVCVAGSTIDCSAMHILCVSSFTHSRTFKRPDSASKPSPSSSNNLPSWGLLPLH